MSTGCTSSQVSSRDSGGGAAAGAGAVSTGSAGLQRFLVEHPRAAAAERSHQQERDVRHAGDQAHHAEQRRGDAERARLTEQLLRELAAHVLRAGHARDDHRDRGRDQQRRNLRDQAVADREQRVDARRVAERHVVRQHADARGRRAC